MAILKDIKVAITINGQELKEYDDEEVDNDDQNSVSKYVEAASDAEFQIMTSAPTSYHFTSDAVRMNIYMDGAFVDAFLLAKGSVGRIHAWHVCSSGARNFDGNRWKVEPFKFREITAVDNGSQRPDDTTKRGQVNDLGTVNIEFHHHKIIGKSSAKGWGLNKDLPGACVVSEKQLKGKNVTHGVAFGDAREIHDSSNYVYNSVPVVVGNSLVAKFTFRYCSRKALQALLLIPRTPSPPREPILLPLEERNIEDLTPEEMRELIRRQRNAIKNEASVKREGTKAERGVKREHDDEYGEIMRSAVSKKIKSRSFEPGETIDLD